MIARLFASHHAPCVVTAGAFDGVHCGHRALVSRAAAVARSRSLRLTAVTFSPRPDAVRRPPACPTCAGCDERVARLQARGRR